ncbi:MAG: AI-2E family transporter [Tissierellia bacterium]|nr:AI-2E family transporter [Tissierellia bacterium]
MKLDNNNRQKLKVFLISILFFFVLYRIESIGNALGSFMSIIAPFIIGFIIAFMVNLPLKFFEEKVFKKLIKNDKKKKLRIALSLIVSYLLIFFVIGLLLYLIIPQLANTAKGLKDSLPDFINMAIKKMEKYPILDSIREKAQQGIESYDWDKAFETARKYFVNGSAFSDIGNVISSIVTSFANVLIGLVFSIYVLLSKKKLKVQSERMLYSLFKENIADYLNHIASVINKAFSGYIKGQITNAGILGVICFIGMTIMGMKNALMISVIIGFTDLIPIIGPFLGGAIGAIFLFIDNPTHALIFVIYVIILQQLESNVTYPLIVGGELGIPSMWTIVAITIGGSIFGVFGMILFVPLSSVIYTLLGEFTKYRLKKKEVEIEQKY